MKIPFRYRGLLYLTLLLVVTPLFVWRLALRETAATSRQYHREKSELAALQQMESAPEKSREAAIDLTEQIESGLLLQSLVPLTEKHRVAIENYTPYVSERQGKLTIRTAEVVLSGGYIPLLRVVDAMEATQAGCRLISLSFHTVADRRTRTKELKAVLLIRQITQNN